MPILPHNQALYPPDWPQIRARILARAGECRAKDDGRIILEANCEWCGVQNHAYGYREKDGRFTHLMGEPTQEWDALALDGYKTFRVVLTIAHLDHDPRNCADDNLAALCQQCHNRHDRPHRNRTRKYGSEVGQLALPQ